MSRPMTPDLITRLEAAAEGSRELDRALVEHFEPPTVTHTGFVLPPGFGKGMGDGWWGAEPTRSIDAAVALVRAKLPGWAIGLDIEPASSEAFVDRPANLGWELPPKQLGRAPTAPLALVIALLKALRALTAVAE